MINCRYFDNVIISVYKDMTENEIKEMLMNGESVTLECTRAKTEVPKSVWETYSAFANAVCGMILTTTRLNVI